MRIDSKATPDTPDGRANRDTMIKLAMEKGSAAIAEKMLPTLVAPAAIEHNAPLVADLRQMITATPPATIMHALAAMRDRPDRSADLAQLACPTLVLAGEEDSIIPPEMTRALASTLKHPTLRLIPNAGHLTPYEAPAAVTAAMEEFLEQIAA
jgi:pimeloyl-ACP methyl ester carboxylesterase